jgi:hypothetical protein
LANNNKKLLFKDDLRIKSCPMIVLSCIGEGAISERGVKSRGMNKFTAVVVDWLLEDKVKRDYRSSDKHLNSVRRILRSKLLNNLGPLQEPAQLNDVDVLSRLIEETQDFVVSAKPFENIYSRKGGEVLIGNTVHLDVKSTLVRISPNDLNALIRDQIGEFYRELLSGKKGESFPKAIRIINNLNRVRIREDILGILERDFIVAFLHDYKEYVNPWIQKHYRYFNMYLENKIQEKGSSGEPEHDLRGMLDHLITLLNIDESLSNMDENQKFDYFKKLKDIQQLGFLFSSFYQVNLLESKKDSKAEFEKLVNQYEKCLEQEKQQKGKSVGSKVSYLRGEMEYESNTDV